jgi:hypothetical protein
VHVMAPTILIGDVETVTITGTGTNSLFGSLTPSASAAPPASAVGA